MSTSIHISDEIIWWEGKGKKGKTGEKEGERLFSEEMAVLNQICRRGSRRLIRGHGPEKKTEI